MTDPRTTVVVITHNRRPELLRTLGHLTELPERPPVIVVDNASSDGTADAVARLHPRVRLLCPGRNLGAVGRNLAVREVRTPYVAFCDDDSWWAPGSLSGAADLLDRYPALATVTARILVEPGSTEDPINDELRDSPVPAPDWLPGPALGSFLAAATALRTDAFRAAGGFHPRLWLGGEEELLAADLAANGWWLTYAEHLTIHHQPSAVRDSTLRRAHGIRNTLWFTWLRRPGRTRAAPHRVPGPHGPPGHRVPTGLRGGRGRSAMGAARAPGAADGGRGADEDPGGGAAALGRPPLRGLRPAGPGGDQGVRGGGAALGVPAPVRGPSVDTWSVRGDPVGPCSPGVRPPGPGPAPCAGRGSGAPAPAAGTRRRPRWRPGRRSPTAPPPYAASPAGCRTSCSGFRHGDHLLGPGVPRSAGTDAEGSVQRHSNRNAAYSVTGQTAANAQITPGSEVEMPDTMSPTDNASSRATAHGRGVQDTSRDGMDLPRCRLSLRSRRARRRSRRRARSISSRMRRCS
ncbi:GT2 family glycosyltransferase [Streptomyces rishiriensis]|uniref:GT2 family glycosyltransferase n=1 Tax=Streptomyces rishiriensis TaxID=68264 RepID=A0ABU0NYT0_STRRH|nr:GT2 family glycosyltransferase [Streptomyces rishiriensis]